MSLYKTFKTNEQKEIDGVPIEINEARNDDGTVPTFFVARQSRRNKKFAKTMKEISKPHQEAMDKGTLSDEVGADLLRTAFIRGCLRGWLNVLDEQGNLVPFNEETAEKLFVDLPDLFDQLQSESSNIANYRAYSLEAEAKN